MAPHSVLTVQGTLSTALIILHSGMAELLDAPGFRSGISAEDILGSSIRVGLIKGESICGSTSLSRKEPNRWSIRTISECVVSCFPVSADEFTTLIHANKPLSAQIPRALLQRIESAVFLFTNFKYLWHKLASIADSIALAVDWSQPREPRKKRSAPDTPAIRIGTAESPRDTLDLENYSAFLRGILTERHTEAPARWDPNLFLDTLQQTLDLYADIDRITIEDTIDYPEYLFMKRLVKKPEKLLTALFHKDEPLFQYIVKVLNTDLELLLAVNRDIGLKIRAIAGKLYGSDGWVSRAIEHPNAVTDDRAKYFLHYLWKFSTRFNSDIQKLLDIPFAVEYPILGRLRECRIETPQKTGTHGARESRPSRSSAEHETRMPSETARLEKYRGLFRQILDFSELGQPFAKKITSALEAVKALPDTLASDRRSAEIREEFAALYWELYAACFLKVIASDLKRFIPGIMLHFGLLDETMVSAEELAQIDTAYARALHVAAPIPVMTLPHFLDKVFTGAVQPSVSELGESFADLLRRQEKMTNRERAQQTMYQDTPESRVRYEVLVIARYLARLLSGSRRKTLPVLCSAQLGGDALRLFQEPEKLSDYVQQIRQRDRRLFFREVVHKSNLGVDLIEKEVLPNLVLYPAAGSRGMMWQELDGTKKESPARFFIPLFFSEKIDDLLVTLIGHFRWELARTAAGHNWMDPVEGGLCGVYYDYIAFYKKNPGLSPAYRELVKDFIARTRSDRDRFTEDYQSWVIHEYEGKIRLNPVARSIFYRFCPFPLSVRNEMTKNQMYSELEMKYQNRVKKDILRLESRIRRFERYQMPVPADFRAYMEMLTD